MTLYCTSLCSPCQSTSHTLLTTGQRIHCILPILSQTGQFQPLGGHPCQLPSLLHNRERKGISISRAQAESSHGSVYKETGGWWGTTMERQLHGTSYIVQARGKGCWQPEPINFHIPFQSDLKTKRVTFSAGTLQRERGGRKEKGIKNDSANSEKGQQERAWRDESALASGDGGKEAFLLCWFVQADWSQPSTGTASEQELPDRLRGEKTGTHTDNIFIKYICDLPADCTFFYLLIVDLLDAGGGGGRTVVWGFLCVWWWGVG